VLTLLAWTRVRCCPGSRLCGSGRNQTLARRPARRPNERGPYIVGGDSGNAVNRQFWVKMCCDVLRGYVCVARKVVRQLSA
jgi:hypothetical protein